MLKSLQSSKSAGLKDLLRPFYLSLLMSAKGRQTYSTFLHLCSDPSPTPLKTPTSFSEHCFKKKKGKKSTPSVL